MSDMRVKICLECKIYVPIYIGVYDIILECFCNKHHGHPLVNIPIEELDRKVYNRYVPRFSKRNYSKENEPFIRTKEVW